MNGNNPHWKISGSSFHSHKISDVRRVALPKVMPVSGKITLQLIGRWAGTCRLFRRLLAHLQSSAESSFHSFVQGRLPAQKFRNKFTSHLRPFNIFRFERPEAGGGRIVTTDRSGQTHRECGLKSKAEAGDAQSHVSNPLPSNKKQQDYGIDSVVVCL